MQKNCGAMMNVDTPGFCVKKKQSVVISEILLHLFMF